MLRFYGWRGSGKSISIMKRAFNAAMRGEKVLIIVPNKAMKHNMESKLYWQGWNENCHTDLIDVKVMDDYGVSNYDRVMIDEAALCLDNFFGGKLDVISDSINEDCVTEDCVTGEEN